MSRARRNSMDRAKGRANNAAGSIAECAIKNMMTILGFRSVRKIHNHWVIQRAPSGKVVGAKAGEPVVGDIAAVVPGEGRSVLCEVKHREKLSYSDLEVHQHAALREHAKNGGLSLIGWHTAGGTFLFDYCEICGPKGSDAPLRPGKRISAPEARQYALTSMPRKTEEDQCDTSPSHSLSCSLSLAQEGDPWERREGDRMKGGTFYRCT